MSGEKKEIVPTGTTVVSCRVSRGYSAPIPGEEAWTKRNYEIEIKTPVANLEGVTTWAEKLIDSWLGIPSQAKPTPVTKESTAPLVAETAPARPSLEPGLPNVLARLPWISYGTKEPARPEESAWIFSNQAGGENLREYVKRHGGKNVPVKIGDRDYLCSFSGPDNKFIARHPKK